MGWNITEKEGEKNVDDDADSDSDCAGTCGIQFCNAVFAMGVFKKILGTFWAFGKNYRLFSYWKFLYYLSCLFVTVSSHFQFDYFVDWNAVSVSGDGDQTRKTE